MNRTPDDVLLSLRRTDKHYLGSGGGLIFAPPHPRWLDYPGFWDGVQLFMQVLRPAFTFALLDSDGRELALARDGRVWTPDHLETTGWAGTVRLTERSVVLARRVACEVTLENPGTSQILLWYRGMG